MTKGPLGIYVLHTQRACNLPHVQAETWRSTCTKLSTPMGHSRRQRHPPPLPPPTWPTGRRTTPRLLRSVCGWLLPRFGLKLPAHGRQANRRTRGAPTASRAFGSVTCAASKSAGRVGAPGVRRWAGRITALMSVARPLSWNRASRAMTPELHPAC